MLRNLFNFFIACAILAGCGGSVMDQNGVESSSDELTAIPAGQQRCAGWEDLQRYTRYCVEPDVWPPGGESSGSMVFCDVSAQGGEMVQSWTSPLWSVAYFIAPKGTQETEVEIISASPAAFIFCVDDAQAKGIVADYASQLPRVMAFPKSVSCSVAEAPAVLRARFNRTYYARFCGTITVKP